VLAVAVAVLHLGLAELAELAVVETELLILALVETAQLTRGLVAVELSFLLVSVVMAVLV
jgi:hypothetical protein